MDNRYYFEKTNLSNDSILISGQEHMHLTRVRRAKVYDKIVAFCGDGFDYNLEIEEITKNNTTCKVLSRLKNTATDRPNITVYLASIKSDALDQAIDSLTQLNIKNINIFESEYTNVRYTDEKIEKIKNKCIQYCKQCERADIPEFKILKFNTMLDELKTNDLNIFAYENAEENFLTINFADYKDKKIAVIVGGEGGFSSSEVISLSEVARKVSLGKTILRAPVAVTAVCAGILANLGEWHK